eukprot:2013790-Pyramimonas_sp.AAC.1
MIGPLGPNGKIIGPNRSKSVQIGPNGQIIGPLGPPQQWCDPPVLDRAYKCYPIMCCSGERWRWLYAMSGESVNSHSADVPCLQSDHRSDQTHSGETSEPAWARLRDLLPYLKDCNLGP